MGPFQWREFFSAAALIVSIFAFGISFVTVYFTVLRASYLRVRFGGTLMVQTQKGGKFRFMPEVILHNEGAKPIVVYKISAHLRRKADGTVESLRWNANLSTIFDSDTRGTDTRFESYPTSIFIAKGEVVKPRLQLDTKHQLKLASDDYYLELTILSDGSSNKSEKTSSTIRVSSEDIKFFDDHQPDIQTNKWRNLRFFYEYGEGVDAYLGESQS